MANDENKRSIISVYDKYHTNALMIFDVLNFRSITIDDDAIIHSENCDWQKLLIIFQLECLMCLDMEY